MCATSRSPVFWEEYLSNLFALSSGGSGDLSGRSPRILEQENLAPAGKLLVQLRINDLIRHIIAEPPVPLPDPRRCGRKRCPLDWLRNVYVVSDSAVRTAALGLMRRDVGEETVLEFLIQVNTTALPPDRKYLNMIVAHEIAHLLFIQELPGGEIIQYLNLTHSPGKAKAEWLIYELAREIVAPTHLLAHYLSLQSHPRPALVELMRTSRAFGMPEHELVGALLHSNAYLNWLRLESEVRAWLAKNPHLSHLFLEFMHGYPPISLLNWAKSLVIIVDFTKEGKVKTRKHIGKLWGQTSSFIPDESYQVLKKVRSGLAIDRLTAQCVEWLNLIDSEQVSHAQSLLLDAPIDKSPVLDRCPELAKLIRQWKCEHVIEVMTKKTRLGHRVYILVRPQHSDPQGLLMER